MYTVYTVQMYKYMYIYMYIYTYIYICMYIPAVAAKQYVSGQSLNGF
jgi:hypothetical protein